MVKINEYPVKENEAAIVLDERKDGWKKLAQLRALLEDRYNFYIETDGVGNIFVHLADNNCDEMGSERYKWVSAEEDDFLEGNREEEQANKDEATTNDLDHWEEDEDATTIYPDYYDDDAIYWDKDAVASACCPDRDDVEYAQDEMSRDVYKF